MSAQGVAAADAGGAGEDDELIVSSGLLFPLRVHSSTIPYFGFVYWGAALTFLLALLELRLAPDVAPSTFALTATAVLFIVIPSTATLYLVYATAAIMLLNNLTTLLGLLATNSWSPHRLLGEGRRTAVANAANGALAAAVFAWAFAAVRVADRGKPLLLGDVGGDPNAGGDGEAGGPGSVRAIDALAEAAPFFGVAATLAEAQ